jgi:hypothetical protein
MTYGRLIMTSGHAFCRLPQCGGGKITVQHRHEHIFHMFDIKLFDNIIFPSSVSVPDP